jgi:IPT/TIG domain-containing protein
MRLPVPRLVLLACALLALLPAGANAASKGGSYPLITSVSPAKLGIGDVMTITGKNFRKGKNKNTVVFKRDGGRAVFVKAPDATTTKIGVTVPAKLLPFLLKKKGKRTFTLFRVRVLSKKFAKKFTPKSKSPMIGPDAIGGGTADDCDGDKVKNKVDTDDDNDLIPDTLEATLGTDACKRDTDGDGMSDGWEYYSALDRNGTAKPAPIVKPYPNPLYAKDADTDNDGDGLTNVEEYAAWATFGANKLPLSYSGGNPASAGRGAPPASQAYMDRDHNGLLSDFERDADGDGIPNMDESRAVVSDSQAGSTVFRLTTPVPAAFSDFGLFTPDYLESAEEATHDPKRCAGINQVPFYCVEDTIDVSKVDTLDWLSTDSDGDGIRDGADDVDHDSVPNLDEYLREIYSSAKDRHYGQLDACYPNVDSAFCLIGSEDIDGDGVPNRFDNDDDGDGLSDVVEQNFALDPLQADTDGDGVSDGYEYWSAQDLNGAAVPFPGKAPYPNALDGSDANIDFDGDGLTLKMEYQAWNYVGRPQPLNYSDGNPYTGGSVLRDGQKDVDNDGLTNVDEAVGPMRIIWWTLQYNGTNGSVKETPYPDVDRRYLEPSFIDPDSDGDGILDGNDDQDHDGYPNWFEVRRPDGSAQYAAAGYPNPWDISYTSTGIPFGTGTHTNRLARVNPYNPCKPIQSPVCHNPAPLGYYPPGEDWQSDTTPSTAPPMGTLPGIGP